MHIDTSALWIQQKWAGKQISYGKIAGSEHPADGQTNFVGSELLLKFASMLNCNFPEGRAENRNSIYSLGAKVDLSRCHRCEPEVVKQLQALGSRIGRGDLVAWSRCDLGSATFRTTQKNGPHWAQVQGRLTMEMRTNKVIESKMIGDISRSLEHARVPTGKTDLITYLLFAEDRWSATSTNTCT